MIAFLITDIAIRGGTHKQFLKLLKYVDSMKKDFFIVTYKVDFENTYPEFLKYKNKIKIITLKKSSNYLTKFIVLIFNFIRIWKATRRAKIINIHDNGFEFYLPVFIGKKVYWQINDLPGYFKVGVNKGKKTMREKLASTYTYFFSRCIVTDFSVNVSKNKDRIKQCLNRDAQVFYCGVEPILCNKNVIASLENFKNKKINLLSSGVFFTYRNYETQIEVVKKIKEQGVDVYLRIIGSTTLNKQYAQKIQSLIIEKKLEHEIIICGQVDEQEFVRLHSTADAFMFINIDQSWGLAVFEAMSCGLPVIVSNSVGATEILQNRQHAIFVNPTDAEEICNEIILLMNDPQKYKYLSEQSKNFHLNYTWEDAYCSKILDLFYSKT